MKKNLASTQEKTKGNIPFAPRTLIRNPWFYVALALEVMFSLSADSMPQLNQLPDATTINQTVNTWAFQYRYDERKRVVARKTPGADWVWIVYDSRDRVVLTQDGNQRAAKLWAFTKYDALNRPVLTGIMDTTIALTQAQMQTVVNSFYSKPSAKMNVSRGGPIHGYTNESYPLVTSPDKFLSVTWYDDYTVRNYWRSTNQPGFSIESAEANSNWTSTPVGLQTGTKLKVLDGGTWGSNSWLTSIKYYDEKLRLIQTIEENIKGGLDRTTIIRDFTGKELETITTHNESDPTWVDARELKIVGNKVSRTSTTTGWTSGAVSEQQLDSGADGWIELEFGGDAGNVAFGFNQQNAQPTLAEIDFAININGSTLKIFENGNSKSKGVALLQGDIVRIERKAGIVSYKRNGSVLYNSKTSSTASLLADIALNSPGAYIQNLKTSFCNSSHRVHRKMSYDQAGRLIEERQTVDSGPEIILSKNEYNELGQLVGKRLHSTDNEHFFQSNSYRHNIRGWLTSINGDEVPTSEDQTMKLFGLNLHYNDSETSLGNQPQFNGNISAMTWTNYLGIEDAEAHGYLYSYDPLKRLLSADFKVKTNAWANPTSFDEGNYTYDRNGNILSLRRNDADGTIDDLTYDYGSVGLRSNRLLSTADVQSPYKGFREVPTTGPDYSYDANGNMLTDQNKGITSIRYNHLNLPETITRGTGNSTQYIYDATGNKLSQWTNFNSAQKRNDFVGAFKYENDVLQSITNNEGHVAYTGRELIYRNEGDFTAGMTRSNLSVTVDALNGGQSYLKVVPTSKNARGELTMGSVPVVPGDKLVFRLKGYRVGSGASVHAMIRVNGAEYGWPGAALPDLASAESWVEHFITVPSNAQVLSFGIAWSKATPVINVFYLNDIELFKLTSTEPEYQYDLKDHLGNVRLTFTTAQKTEDQLATIEPGDDYEGQAHFLRYNKMRRVNSHLFDRTNGVKPSTITGYAERLNGSVNERVGLAKSLSVMPGDTVRMEVYAKYVDPDQTNWSSALATIMNYLVSGATAPAGTIMDGAEYATGNTLLPAWAIGSFGNSESLQAGLAYIMFDRDMGPIWDPAQTNVAQISTAPREYGQDVSHERLFAEVVVRQPGFMYVYLSNNEDTPVDVYFDDFRVEHAKGPVVQSQEYYAFGDRFNAFTREDSDVQRNLYNNGSRIELALDLNVYETQFRTFDPVLGRWWQVDPKPDQGGQESWSVYQYSFDSPMQFNDPSGMWPEEPEPKDGNFVQNLGHKLSSVYKFFAGNANPKEKAELALRMTFPVDLIAVSLKTMDNLVGEANHDITKEEYVNAATDIASFAPAIFLGPESKLSPLRALDDKVYLATEFYQRSGFKSGAIRSHLDAIDFSKDVSVKVLSKGTKVNQWVGPHGIGNYFTAGKNSRQNVGIRYDNRTLKTFELNEDVAVLQSTAADFKGSSGGGAQYFSTELKTKIRK